MLNTWRADWSLHSKIQPAFRHQHLTEGVSGLLCDNTRIARGQVRQNFAHDDIVHETGMPSISSHMVQETLKAFSVAQLLVWKEFKIGGPCSMSKKTGKVPLWHDFLLALMEKT
jgi:hypothetical protein